MAYIQQLLKGLIDPIVLALLGQLPMYGYQIVKESEQRTAGYLKMKEGTVYPSLLRLEKKGLVDARWKRTGKRRERKYYQITEKGRQVLASSLTEWHDLCTAINKLTQNTDPQDKVSQRTEKTAENR